MVKDLAEEHNVSMAVLVNSSEQEPLSQDCLKKNKKNVINVLIDAELTLLQDCM